MLLWFERKKWTRIASLSVSLSWLTPTCLSVHKLLLINHQQAIFIGGKSKIVIEKKTSGCLEWVVFSIVMFKLCNFLRFLNQENIITTKHEGSLKFFLDEHLMLSCIKSIDWMKELHSLFDAPELKDNLFIFYFYMLFCSIRFFDSFLWITENKLSLWILIWFLKVASCNQKNRFALFRIFDYKIDLIWLWQQIKFQTETGA